MGYILSRNEPSDETGTVHRQAFEELAKAQRRMLALHLRQRGVLVTRAEVATALSQATGCGEARDILTHHFSLLSPFERIMRRFRPLD